MVCTWYSVLHKYHTFRQYILFGNRREWYIRLHSSQKYDASSSLSSPDHVRTSTPDPRQGICMFSSHTLVCPCLSALLREAPGLLLPCAVSVARDTDRGLSAALLLLFSSATVQLCINLFFHTLQHSPRTIKVRLPASV